MQRQCKPHVYFRSFLLLEFVLRQSDSDPRLAAMAGIPVNHRGDIGQQVPHLMLVIGQEEPNDEASGSVVGEPEQAAEWHFGQQPTMSEDGEPNDEASGSIVGQQGAADVEVLSFDRLSDIGITCSPSGRGSDSYVQV